MHCSALDWTGGVLGIVCTCVCMCGGGRVGALLLRGASCKGSSKPQPIFERRVIMSLNANLRFPPCLGLVVRFPIYL